MQLYSIKVRLGGLVNNEVRKSGVTAAEIMVLRALHGDDAVVDITSAKMDHRTHAEERARLNAIYCNKETSSPETFTKKREMLRGLFGADTADLPVKLPEDVPAAPGKPRSKPGTAVADVDVSKEAALA